jgi:uncharacterized membrane protein
MKPRHLALLLWVLIALQCFAYYGQLPPTLASHFDSAGRPNGWSSKEAFIELYLFVAGLMTFLFFSMPGLLRRIPLVLINIPNRDYWLVPERKDRALEMLQEEMGWSGTGVLGMLVATIQLAIKANLSGGLLSGAMWILLVAFILFTVALLIRLYRRFARPSEPRL